MFEKYLNLERDDFELLHHVISEIEEEHIRYNYYQKDQMPSQVTFDVEDLELRVQTKLTVGARLEYSRSTSIL